MNIINFLKDLNEPSAECLNETVVKYLENYSFSTLDILLTKREILSLEIEDLYKKIIIDRRGGYCFEHNKLFHYFLVDSGFKVSKQLARVVYGKDIDVPRTHRINIVSVKGEDYLIDVGFGAYTPNYLIPMNGDQVKCPNGNTYRITKNRMSIFSLEILREEGFFTFYTFDMGVYTESDFDLSSYYSNTHPKSKHAHDLIMSINKDKATMAILNRTLITFINGKKIEEEIESAKKMQKILKENFKVDIASEEVILLFDSL